MTELEIEGRRLTLSSPERMLWPEAGFTKRRMLDYYTAVAPALLPHIEDRPLTLARFPEGVDAYGWYQTQCRGRPEWLPTRRVGSQDYCVVSDLPSLLWAANRGAVELHPLLARGERTDEPSVVVFDLDPGAPADLVDCCRVALELRGVLADAGLASVPKTSGSLGLHVYVPLNTRQTYAETKPFARTIAALLAARHPDRVVDRTARSLRAGKVLVDWGQNAETKSTIAPYSLRAMRYPTVSTPLAWAEVEAVAAQGGRERLTFGPDEARARVARLGDLFLPVLELAQTLP